MIAWSRKHTWTAGLLILILTNVVALGGVAYNRMGEPEAVLMLTERELTRPYSSGFNRENSGISLVIEWRTLQRMQDGNPGYIGRWAAVEWLDETRLTELGFDANGAAATRETRSRLNHSLPREVWLVLEYDGPAYQAMLERVRAFSLAEQELAGHNPGNDELKKRAKRAKKLWDTEQQGASRLFVVDAGLDPSLLRKQYPDMARYVVVQGRVRAAVSNAAENKWLVQGYIQGLSVGSVNVPLGFRHVFEDSPGGHSRNNENPAHYLVTLAYGQRQEPWIVSAEKKKR
ncbi:MAG TPA: DUF4824 family protein [Gammaproteobacteria bacterium]|nr:DUF4824 family protein [Gammaproteobacteria bacterium]